MENMKNYLAHAAIIGKELEKFRIEMTELDPRNLYQTENQEIKIGSCFKFLPFGQKISNLENLEHENVL